MTGAAAETVAVVLLVASLGFAVLRPRGLSEAVVAVPAALLVVVLGIVPWRDALHALGDIGPTVGFLAAILVFGHLCAEAQVFVYLGGVASRLSRGDPRRLLTLVVALAAGVTATLTLDATVVLVTPVVLATVARLKVPARPFAYACTRLANSGSLLLPVSNLTNLLAFTAAGLSFGRFAALMLLPWLLVCLLERVGIRWFFRRDFAAPPEQQAVDPPPAPRYALVVLAVTVALFVVTSAIDVSPALAAVAGCLALLAPHWRTVRPLPIVRAASVGFCLFVFALSVIVVGVTSHGLGDELAKLVPDGTSLLALLGVAAVAAVLANVVNNLPATLALLPVVTGSPAAVLAVLIGVNVGPNATYAGSLATLLWRRLLPADHKPRAGEFHLLGLLSVPVLIVVAVAALWLGVRTVGL